MSALALAFADLDHLTAGRTGTFDVPCPLCAPFHNPRRRVLRIWRDERSFSRFHCVRCEERGCASESASSRSVRPSPERIEALRQEAANREETERARKLQLARHLWASRQPIHGTLAERYLREARGYQGAIPQTLGYLPPNGPHPHAMVAAFGLADEPKLGVVQIADEAVRGVHLTKLNPDGSKQAKIMLGSSTGFPIVLAPPNDLLGLAIAEGIEDALSLHETTGLGAWAAGAAGRLPGLADKVPGIVEAVTIAADADPIGQTKAIALADALAARGFETFILGAAS